MAKIGIIIGSVRENRKALTIGKWIVETASNDDNVYSILDLKDFNLPHYNEPGSPRTSNGYVHETTIRWSNAVKEYDGFIFVTPEYNGFFPAAIKDAVDYLYHEWTFKPFAIVGYGGRGGKWAAGHLATLLKRFDMPDCGYVGVHKPKLSIAEDGSINPEFVDGNLSNIFQQIDEHIKK